MELATEPRLVIPSRNHSSRAILDRAVDILGQFRKEIDGIKTEIAEQRNNNLGLAGLLDGVMPGGMFGGATAGYNQDTSTYPNTLANANAYVPISLQRILLNYTYMTQGLIRTLVDQPVEDAFRGGLKFKSSELDEDDVAKLNRQFKRKRAISTEKSTALTRVNVSAGYNLNNSDQEAVKAVAKWARLFGGAGLIVNTDQNFTKELNVEAIKEDSPLEFIPADRWELVLQQVNIFDQLAPTPFSYYGLPLHRSRVAIMLWGEAPSYIRLRLQGWGMSILEESIRAVNAYLKFEKLLFELLDEAKIDVYKIKGFNTALASPASQQRIQQRVLLGNQLKNFQSAITMDMEDDYNQKQLSFTGIAEIYEQLRTNLCAYLKFPKNKLFGESAGGFSSGKDSLDNYNSTVGGVREQVEPIALGVGELRCQQLFGFVPEDLECEWCPLDVLDGVEQESVKTTKQTRIVEQFQMGLISGEEACESLQKEGLLLVECEVLLGLRDVEPPMSQNPEEMDKQQKGQEKLASMKAKKTPHNGGKA